jgi:hypothetical protein
MEPGRVKVSDKISEAKFVQVTTSVHGGEILLYALDELGDVWRFDDKTRQWVMLPRDRVRRTPPGPAHHGEPRRQE